MGKKYLIDTNILIYYFNDTLPNDSISLIDNLFDTSFNISVITKIEFLGWSGYRGQTFKKAMQILDYAQIYNLNDEIVDKTIGLKRKTKIKTPDAIIAATCLVYKFGLITRNSSDFIGINRLNILNPFDL
jgi:predicted nucleic acid-binding protein